MLAYGTRQRSCLSRRALRTAWTIADQPCAIVAAKEHDFAIMKVRQLSAMTNADEGCVCELLRQQAHHPILAP